MPPSAWIVGFLGAFGAVLLWRGVRGAPRLAAPQCGRCGYDVRITLRAGGEQCPECGATLGRPDSVRFGRHSRSPIRITLGVLLIIPAMLYGSNVLVQRRTGFRWRQIQPTSSLIAVIDDPRAAGDAWAVLERRYVEGRLDDDDVASAVEAVIATLGRSTLGPNAVRDAAGFLLMARRDRRMSETQWRRLVERLFAGPPSLNCRSSVRSGQRLPFNVTGTTSHLANTLGLQTLIHVEGATLDGAAVPLGDERSPHTGRRSGHVVLDVSPGDHELAVQVEMAVIESRGPLSPRPPGLAWDDALLRWQAVASAPVTVLAADEYPFERVDDPERVADFRETLSVIGARVIPTVSGPTLEVTLQFVIPDDEALCYEVLARIAGHEHPLGQFRARGGSFSGSCRLLSRASLRRGGPIRLIVDGPVGSAPGEHRIDLVLRPQITAAEQDPAVERLLDAEIVIEDVRLDGP